MRECSTECYRGGVRCHDPAFRDLRPADSSVRFHRCRLGYYALPPREVQRISPPVFALDGTVSTPALERYDFTRYVPAVRPAAKNGAMPRSVPAF